MLNQAINESYNQGNRYVGRMSPLRKISQSPSRENIYTNSYAPRVARPPEFFVKPEYERQIDE